MCSLKVASYVDLVEPVIEESPVSQIVNARSVVNFTCIAAGNPNPRIMWLSRNIPLSDTDRYSVDGGVLTILSTTAADTGSYTCLAHNTVNNRTDHIDFSVNASAHLTVLGSLLPFLLQRAVSLDIPCFHSSTKHLHNNGKGGGREGKWGDTSLQRDRYTESGLFLEQRQTGCQE